MAADLVLEAMPGNFLSSPDPSFPSFAWRNIAVIRERSDLSGHGFGHASCGHHALDQAFHRHLPVVNYQESDLVDDIATEVGSGAGSGAEIMRRRAFVTLILQL